jgi:hypothetical protein
MQQSHAAALYLNLPMRVAGSVDVRTRFVDFGMDGEGCCVDGLFAFYDFTVFVDEDEVAHADLGEVSRKRVEPWVLSLTWGVRKLRPLLYQRTRKHLQK